MENIKGEIADLHLHSRYSRACSKDITVENLAKWGKIKGLNLLGTSDFTHELWLKELKENLTDEGSGIFRFKKDDEMKFVLSGEISLMYTQDKGRRVHLVLLAPDFDIVSRINKYLDSEGRRDYDGRPIFSMTCYDFVKQMKNISDEIEIIPAHCMTPWFGIFGSKSGFDSLKEAFKDEADKIYALETGMSADPGMLGHLSMLNNKSMISFSDSHSFWPWRLGREATIFSKIEKYGDIIKQIRENKILRTIETSPSYGIYHWDGHRLCNFSSSPKETKKLGGICPVCKKQMTIGVENRVEKLTDQKPEQNPNRKSYYTLLPLHELIALAKATTMSSKKAWLIYNKLIENFRNEFNILLNVSESDLLKALPEDKKLVELILRNRLGKINVKPGYDGEYGKPLLEEEQKRLF